jgi:hypothetical protein
MNNSDSNGSNAMLSPEMKHAKIMKGKRPKQLDCYCAEWIQNQSEVHTNSLAIDWTCSSRMYLSSLSTSNSSPWDKHFSLKLANCRQLKPVKMIKDKVIEQSSCVPEQTLWQRKTLVYLDYMLSWNVDNALGKQYHTKCIKDNSFDDTKKLLVLQYHH